MSKGKTKGFAPKMYSYDRGSHFEPTGYDDASAAWTEQTEATSSTQLQACLSPKSCRGTVECLNGALGGPRLSQNEATMVKELPGLPNCPHPVEAHLEAGEVHNRLDENGVVADVRVLGVELGEWAEERTATGDVHLAHRSLEGRGRDVGSEGVDDVLPVALVQQHQCHLEMRKK